MNEIRFYRSTGVHGFLSNLFPCDVEFEGRRFASAEAAYQFGKPRDPAIAEWLAAAPTPACAPRPAMRFLAMTSVPTGMLPMSIGCVMSSVRSSSSILIL